MLRLRLLIRPRQVCGVARTYSTLPTSCPSCGKPLPTRLPICPACAHIASLPSNTPYHALFDLPENAYTIDVKDLRNRFLRTQRLTHPDAWSSKPEKDKVVAAAVSSLVNKGYETLKSPLRRAEYLLELSGHETGEADSLEDQGFIMDIMEVREQVEETQERPSIEAIASENQGELLPLTFDLSNDRAGHMQEEIQTITKAFESGDLKTAKEATVRLKYRVGVDDSIQAKLHQF